MNRTTQQTEQQIMENDAAALAAEMFDHFCSATTMRQILGLHRNMCDTINLRPGPLNEFYPKLKSKVKNWKAQALWKKFDARASHRVYNKGIAAQGIRVLVIGAGPCGLRAAIEAQLLGAKVVVVEKRDRISRNNVLHLWPFLITDLRNLGAKKFYGKFCAGAIDHISIRQLQCILLKVALLLGVEIHEGISFIKTIEPNDGCGWRAQITPEDHAVSHYEFDVLLGADGKRNTLDGFRRKEFRGKLAIAITANFINKKTEAEARVEEISGVAFIFNQSFFKELYHTTGIDLENIVYYKDETHYFVMTAKKHSLLDKGVIIQDYADPAELLKPTNVNTERLSDYAQEAAGFSTKYQMPNLEFAVNHYGKPDVAMFDFTSMFAAENSSRVTVRKNYRLLQCLVGDSLLEPFWPTGSGCARGFLSSMDAAYAIKLFANHSNSLLAVLAQRESIYRLLAQTTPENLQRDIGAYTLDPSSRYPNLNRTAVSVHQVKNLLDSDDPSLLEQIFVDTNTLSVAIETPIRRKRRTGDTTPLGTVLLRWIKSQLIDHEFSQNLSEVAQCFTNGKVLCALIHRYRPDLIDINDIKNLSSEECNDKAFTIFEDELGIPRALTPVESLTLEGVDTKLWLNYLEHVCEVFRGEIPHVKHPKLDFEELREKNKKGNAVDFSNLLKLQSKKAADNAQAQQPQQIQRRHFHYNQQQPIPLQHHGAEERHQQRTRRSSAEHNVQASVPQDIPRRAKKRRTYDKSQNIEERAKRLAEIESNRNERHTKRREQRRRQTENFLTSLHMLQANQFLRDSDSSNAFDDYSLYVYRQSAPLFNDRVKELERKLLYPDRERGIPSAMPRSGLEDQFSDRIRSMEQRITGKHEGIMEKKPKDLLRAIGKIESNDWNVKEIEKKIEQSKKTEVGKNREKVPKWSREQFLARQNKMSKPLDTTDEKYKEIDTTIKALDKQLKDPVLYERGRNKVASIAGQFVKKEDQEKLLPQLQNADEKLNQIKQSNKVGLVFSNQNISEVCHFCKQRVYLMEKITAEGLVLHRSCLKCHHCHTNLRLGGYAFDRDNPQGLFYCTQHYRLPAKAKSTPKRPQPRSSGSRNTELDGKAKPHDIPSTISDSVKCDLTKMDLMNRGQTPERIEFENADMSDGEPSLDNVIDENEWTDRNFGTGTDASESDITSSESDSDDNDSDMFEEAIGSPLGQTLQIASDWIGKQRYMEDSDDDDSYDSSDDEEVDTQTEGEELAKARELRMQEVKLRPPLCATTTDTETEAQSDSDTSSPDAELNSATEISTDSEFDLDPVTKNPPQIYIDDSYVKKPTKVQIKQGVIENGFSNRQYTTHNIATKEKIDKDVHLKFKPLVQVDPDVLNTNIQPFKNPRPGDYLLNKTPSTEGIASKKSLELKKRYLLGETNLTGGLQKSGSTSILDSKLKNFHSNISECQKLLNPAAEISPTMQMFLRNTKVGENKNIINHLNNNNNNNDEKENIKIDNNRNNDKNKVNETINTTLLENKLKDLEKRQPIEMIDLTKTLPKLEKNSKIIDVYNIDIPSTMIKKNQEFIENLDVKSDVIDLTMDTPVLDRSLEEQNENFNATIPDLIKSSNLSEHTKNKIDLMFDKQNDNIVEKNNDIDEPRARSPAHETTIHVPTILSWEKNLSLKNNDIESDSLSSSSSSSSKSSSTSSIDEIPHYILDSATSPDTQCGTNDKFVAPRLEVRDTTGELMQIDSLMIINGKYVGDPEDLKLLEKLPEGTIILQQTTSSSGDRQIEKCDNNDKSSIDNLLKFEYKKPDLKFDTRNANKIDTLRSIPVTELLETAIIEKPKNLKFQEPNEMEYKIHDYDKTPTISNPNPGIINVVLPVMNEQNSDSETEVTGQALTETELSDWTADDAVSENFVDIEFALNSNKGTIKRNKKKKRSVTIVKETALSQSPAKINSSINTQIGESLGKHLDFDNIEFMDTGSEDSCIETYSTTNKTMLKNRGYVEFVEIDYKLEPKPTSNNTKLPMINNITNKIPIIEAINKDMPKFDFIEQGACILNNDYDLKTPINEPTKTIFNEIRPQTEINQDSIPNDIEEDSLVMFGSQTTTTTEDSDALTVVTSPLDSYPLKLDNLSDLDRQLNSIDDSKTVDKSSSEIEKLLEKTINNGSAPASKEVTKTPDEMSYEEYVRQLQTKIREISSARDSLDMRKTRRKSSKGDDQSINNPTNSINTPTKTLTIFNHKNQDLSPPTVTKKLEEITKERTKQKDLIHDLVMDKLQSKKQLNAEKRLNRSRNRNMFCSPSSVVSHNPNGAPNEVVTTLDDVAPMKKRQETERRHSLHLSTSPAKSVEAVEKSIRPISDYLPNSITTSTPTKLSKTQSFCITQKSDFRTPIIPLQQQYVNQHHPLPPSRIPVKSAVKYEEHLASTEKYRQEARARARLKSNEDLGLSPEDKINLLRKRYNLDVMKLSTNKSDDMKFQEKRLMSSKSVNDITTAHKLALDLRNSYMDLTPKSQPQTPKHSKNFNFINNNISSSSSLSNNTNQIGGSTNKGIVTSKESKKGIIQTVSDFFHKKKDSATTKEGSKSELRFGGLFKLAPKNKAKEKYTPIVNDHSKSENFLIYENGSMQSTSPDKNDDVAPPIPPLPLNYQRSDDENYSMNDKEVNKKYRSISKASRQGELKRLRIAQEIQREQEEIEVKIKELEAQGVVLEKALRGESQDFKRNDPTKSIGANDERLVQELLEIWRNITDLKKRDEELGIRQKELQLEHRHAQLKEELNVRLSCSKLDKSSSDIAAEGAILNEMLDIVAKRAALRPSDIISGGTSSIHSDDHTEVSLKSMIDILRHRFRRHYGLVMIFFQVFILSACIIIYAKSQQV